jgi:hypothetical protein
MASGFESKLGLAYGITHHAIDRYPGAGRDGLRDHHISLLAVVDFALQMCVPQYNHS